MRTAQLGAMHRDDVLAATWAAWLADPTSMEWLQ